MAFSWKKTPLNGLSNEWAWESEQQPGSGWVRAPWPKSLWCCDTKNASAPEILKTVFQSTFPMKWWTDQERDEGEGFDLFRSSDLGHTEEQHAAACTSLSHLPHGRFSPFTSISSRHDDEHFISLFLNPNWSEQIWLKVYHSLNSFNKWGRERIH